MSGKHSRRRPWWRRWWLPAAVAVVLLGAAGAWAVSRSGSGSAPPRSSATSASVTSVPGSAGPGATTAGTATPATTTGVAVPTTAAAGPTTTLAVGPPSSTPGTLSYTVPAGTAVVVSASNPCWIEVRDRAGAPITHVTTLQSGQSLALVSPVWMRLGDPLNVHVTAGGAPVALPRHSANIAFVSA